jgi:hypothetical protein
MLYHRRWFVGRTFTGIILLLGMLVITGAMWTRADAALITIDFSALGEGWIPDTGYDVGPVHISNLDNNSPVSTGLGRMYFLGGRSAVFEFSVPVSQIWATLGSNYTTMQVTAYGTTGTDSFSHYSPWEPGTTGTVTGIGNIYKVEAMGYESWMSNLQYNAVPLPGSILLLIPGLAGLTLLRLRLR